MGIERIAAVAGDDAEITIEAVGKFSYLERGVHQRFVGDFVSQEQGLLNSLLSLSVSPTLSTCFYLPLSFTLPLSLSLSLSLSISLFHYLSSSIPSNLENLVRY
jgi:hypothetical protein